MCEFDARLMIASNAFLQQKPLGPSTSKSEEDTPEGILRIEHVAAAAGVHPGGARGVRVHPARRSTGRTARGVLQRRVLENPTAFPLQT